MSHLESILVFFCDRGVGRNYILCTICGMWTHQRCSGLQNVNQLREFDFFCATCKCGKNSQTVQTKDVVLGLTESDLVEEVESFFYLGSGLDIEGGVEREVRAGVAVAWANWCGIADLLGNRRIPIKSRGNIHDACICYVILYGAGWVTDHSLAQAVHPELR